MNNVVSEFIRFHPIIENAKYFDKYCEVSYNRNTIGTNLALYEDPVKSEFSKSCKQSIRSALNKGIYFEIIENPEDFSDFKRIYYSTMERNQAEDFYFFDDVYFQQCRELLGDKILLANAFFMDQKIASGFYFKYNKIIHMHLSGTLSEYLYLSPAYILEYAITLWGKEHGFDLIHHGGGKSDKPDDSLYLFKKKFTQNTEFQFSIGKNIWNTEAYKELCNISGSDNVNFFPAYFKRH
jgi:lipid II:glycine glycyltransferase (peptidoglycan interpeptide bridge formation enzyme)